MDGEFIQLLAGACRGRLLEDKVLLAPSLRAGHQWVDRLARGGQPALNLRVATVRHLALELAGPALASRALSPITGAGALILTERLWRRMPGSGPGYLRALPAGQGLARGLASTVESLRLSGIAPAALGPSQFESAAKGRELAGLLEAWEKELESRRLADYAGVLTLAVERIALEPDCLPGLLLVPDDLDLHPLERRLLEAVPIERRLDLPSAAGPAGGVEVSFFRAVGEANEVREALRRCLAEGVPLDQVEILHTDAETYLPLIYETLHRLRPLDDEQADLPATFAEGIPIRYSRPGRALAAWLDLIADDFRQSTVVRMLQDGLLNVPGLAESGHGPLSLADIMRTLPIGFGRGSYLPRLEAYRARLIGESAAPPCGEEVEGAAGRAEGVASRLEGVELLIPLLKELLGTAGAASGSPGPALKAAASFLGGLARSVGRLDNFARERLLEDIRELARWLEDAGPGLDALGWLAALPRTRVGGSGPRPGRLHVAHALSGGHTGRPLTFILGLDDRRLPGSGLQDPLLLDHERRRIDDKMPTAAGKLARKVDSFRALMARLAAGEQGRVTLSFSCRDLADDRELFPSPLLVEALRARAGPAAGGGDRLDLLPAPASLAPERQEGCLDEAEWWLWRLSAGAVPPARAVEAVRARYPNLARGAAAEAARRSDLFTHWDGFVPEAGPEASPTAPGGPVISPSRLEKLGACPLAYFFRYLLKLVPPEDLELKPDEWLDPLEYGTLIHEVLHDFMEGLIREGVAPSAARDRRRIEEIAAQRLQAWRRRYPPLTERSFRAQSNRLLRAVRIFLREEQEFYRALDARPLYVEASVGLPPGASPTGFDTPDPVPFPLPGGGSVLVRGRLDRIDRLGGLDGATYAVTDYKSGRSLRMPGGTDPFWKGRVLQHALYLALAEARLRDMGHDGARAALFRYLFPDPARRGEEVRLRAEQLATAGEVVERLCRLLAAGAFPATPTPDEDGCGNCDYRSICGQRDGVAERAKLANPANEPLAPFGQLRGTSAPEEEAAEEEQE